LGPLLGWAAYVVVVVGVSTGVSSQQSQILRLEVEVVSLRSTDERPLRPGDVVEVRSIDEILATLDGDALDGMPFMAEMIRHAGRRFAVTRRVDKICDTIAATGSRRLDATVYLDDLRCDGSGHGGCQAGCKI
jgi:hypothetical protein